MLCGNRWLWRDAASRCARRERTVSIRTWCASPRESLSNDGCRRPLHFRGPPPHLFQLGGRKPMVAGKKNVLAQVMYWTGVDRIIRLLRSGTLIVLTYHRLRKEGQEIGSEFTPFDSNVYGPTVSEFRRTLQWLKDNAVILSENDLLETLATGREPTKPAVMITFDDGYRDNYDLALPVLSELRVPAIYFLPYQQIESRIVGWWDTIAYLIKHSPLQKMR